MSDKRKTRFLVVEGADGSGKTTFCKALAKLPEFELVDLRWRDDKIIRLDPEERLPLVLECFKHFDKSKVFVIDRFILSDIAYNQGMRGEDVTDYIDLWKRFCDDNDVLGVVLDREETARSFKDDKLKVSSKKFNAVINVYRNVDKVLPNVWKRKITTHLADGKILASSREVDELIHDLKIRFSLTGNLLQKEYDFSAWKFFIACACMNKGSGRQARKIVPQLFYEFRTPSQLIAANPARIAKLLEPLGLQNRRAVLIQKMCDDLCSKDITSFIPSLSKGEAGKRIALVLEDVHGLGKYAIDSFRILVAGQRDFEEPLDKELKAWLDRHPEMKDLNPPKKPSFNGNLKPMRSVFDTKW